MWRALVVVAVAGCDQLFGVAPIVVLDAELDAAPPCVPAACSAPQPLGIAAVAQSIAITSDEAYAVIATTTGHLEAISPFPNGAITVVAMPYFSPALLPDGAELFAQGAPGPTTEWPQFARGADVSTTNTLQQPDAAHDRLGAPAVLADGMIHMFVEVADNNPPYLEELVRPTAATGANWSVAGVLDSTKLGLGPSIAIGDPSLSSDGHLLVFVVNYQDVYFVARANVGAPFSSGDRGGLLLPGPATPTIAPGPYITSDCHRLYSIDAQAQVVRCDL